MTVVSDTTAITTLLKAGHIDLLAQLFDHVIIPQAVEDELLAFHTSLPEFVHQHPVAQGVRRLPGTESLGRGEAEAILLAKKLNASLMLRRTVAVLDSSRADAARGLARESRRRLQPA